MAQPQAARTTCGLCNGWYNSENELRNHMQTAHHRFLPEQSTFQHGSTGQTFSRLRNRVQARFNPEELDVNLFQGG